MLSCRPRILSAAQPMVSHLNAQRHAFVSADLCCEIELLPVLTLTCLADSPDAWTVLAWHKPVSVGHFVNVLDGQ